MRRYDRNACQSTDRPQTWQGRKLVERQEETIIGPARLIPNASLTFLQSRNLGVLDLDIAGIVPGSSYTGPATIDGLDCRPPAKVA